MATREVKMYSDYKSPFAYLAFEPGLELEKRYDVRVRWIPFQLRVKDKGQRSLYSEYKTRYSYLDARRWAKSRGLVIRSQLKVYDTRIALIGGLFAQKHDRLLPFNLKVYELFWKRELVPDDPDQVAAVVAEMVSRRTSIVHISQGRVQPTMNVRRRRPPPTISSACRSSCSKMSRSGVTTASQCWKND
jgi:2-hydroxychromene-2-carboxylate isomerase